MSKGTLNYPQFKKSHFINIKLNVILRRFFLYILIYLNVLLTATMYDKIMLYVLLQ